MHQTLGINPKNNVAQFMNVPGVDKVEVYWLSRTIGTEKIFHPVAQRRAQRILSDIRNTIKGQTADLLFLKKQAG